MKIAVATLLGLLFITAPVMAQQTTDTNLPNPSVTMKSPFYGFERAFENFQLAFAFNDEAKANLYYRFAQLRLAEANVLASENETDLASKTLQDYETDLNLTDQETQRAVARGGNVTDLVDLVTNQTFQHVAVLQALREEVPEQEKAEVDKIINDAVLQHSKIASKMQGRNLVNVTVEIGNTTITIAVPSQMAENFIQKAEDIQNRALLNVTIGQERAQNQIQAAQNEISKLDTLNSTLPEVMHLLANAKLHLTDAQTAFNESKYGNAFGQAIAAQVLARNAERFAGHFEENETNTTQIHNITEEGNKTD